MIKLVYCLRRKAGMTRAEFQDYWRTTHAPLVAAAADALAIRRYVQVHTAKTPLSEGLGEARPGMTQEDYDGVAELWWDSEEALVAAMQTPEGQRRGAILAEDEANFIDFAGSRIFFAEENVVVG